jgi:hypothetical protein
MEQNTYQTTFVQEKKKKKNVSPFYNYYIVLTLMCF